LEHDVPYFHRMWRSCFAIAGKRRGGRGPPYAKRRTSSVGRGTVRINMLVGVVQPSWLWGVQPERDKKRYTRQTPLGGEKEDCLSRHLSTRSLDKEKEKEKNGISTRPQPPTKKTQLKGGVNGETRLSYQEKQARHSKTNRAQRVLALPTKFGERGRAPCEGRDSMEVDPTGTLNLAPKKKKKWNQQHPVPSTKGPSNFVPSTLGSNHFAAQKGVMAGKGSSGQGVKHRTSAEERGRVEQTTTQRNVRTGPNKSTVADRPRRRKGSNEKKKLHP